MKETFLIIMFFLTLNSCKKEMKHIIKKKQVNNAKADSLGFLFTSSRKKVYELGTTFRYSFDFISSKSKNRKSISEKEVSEINFVDVIVVNHGDENHLKPALEYSYSPKGSPSSSLVIENDSIVWIHPPRSYFFKILEINPFPSICMTNKKWNDTLKIGQQYADDRWAVWKKNLINTSKYEIVGDTVLETKFGHLKCKRIHAVSQNILGKSYLDSYYNNTYGFVFLKYKNIDNSILNLQLIEYNKKKRKPKIFTIE